ncbi:DUF5988 family protein [Streptomyces osmaniensis]|uniref:Uncharacterized protein n=1 Tax=Streptomyces osmaniensis TaxID=593134 RepID=A0ABP6Z5E6_9ACTN|nr:hypothetical protein KJK32_46095 [Streptomyces sp. JCM17656]
MERENVAGAGRLVVLVGGPPELSGAYRLPDERNADLSRVVVAYYGRHQRFAPTGESEVVGGQLVPVFRFVYSTAIAE